MEWTCPNCGRTGLTSNFCGTCATPRPSVNNISKFNHIEYDEEAYNTILKSFNGIGESYKGTIKNACSDIESAINSFPDSYSASGISSIGSSIDGHIDLISSLAEITNYSLLAYQACDEDLKYQLESLIDSLFGDSETSLADYYKSIIKSAIEEKDGILKYKEIVSDEYKYYTFLSTIYKDYNDDDLFLSSLAGNYGIDQGVFTFLKTQNPELYQKTKEMLIKEYGFTNNSVEQFFSIVDAVGCCNYAAGANALTLAFKDNPDEFEKIFGFSYYIETSNGEKTLNDVRILADYYIWANTVGNEDAEILIRDKNGHLIINEDSYILNENGKYETVHQRNGDIKSGINRYLQYKSGGTYQAQVLEIIKQKENPTPSEMKEKIMDILESGNQVCLGMCSVNDSIDYIASFEKYELDGSHWVAVTGANDEGISVSSWGSKYFIPYSDLEKTNLYSINININNN